MRSDGDGAPSDYMLPRKATTVPLQQISSKSRPPNDISDREKPVVTKYASEESFFEALETKMVSPKMYWPVPGSSSLASDLLLDRRMHPVTPVSSRAL